MNDLLIRDSITIRAPVERCFLLSTRLELVQQTLGMRHMGGTMEPHVIANSRVIWRGWKFGLPTEHHTLITGYESPRSAIASGEFHADFAGQTIAWFQDSQERGRFAAFAHDHYFREIAGDTATHVTVLEDIVRFSLPFGFPGRMVAHSVVAPHVRRLMHARFALLKRIAEGDDWQRYISDIAKEG